MEASTQVEGARAAGAFESNPEDRLTIAIVGGGLRAAEMLRMFADVDGVVVSAVCAPSPTAPAARLADDLGVYWTRDFNEIFQVPDLALVIAEDQPTYTLLESQRPSYVEVVGATGANLFHDLLQAKRRGEEQEKLYVELQTAYDKIRQHERGLEAGKDALENANEELETRLAEIFFTHEFFKALTTFTAVDDVCSLIVDGCNGILGAEISAVYLVEREDWTLRIHAAQGRPQEMFRTVLPLADTIVGYAFREGSVQEDTVDPESGSAAWLIGEEVKSQAAVPLRTGDNIFGVMVLGSAVERELTPAEMERFTVLANQSSLALQNAILHEELERLSVTDRLTELYNHGYLQQRLEEEVNRSERFGHTMALIMIDIDDFKAFNDLYGHTRGDAVLKGVSDVIRANLREMDIAARYGGEEFVVVLPETDIIGGVGVAERMREQFAEMAFAAGLTNPVGRTLSIGVAEYPRHGGTPTRLVEAADAAMYRGKRAGKNRVVASE